MKRAEFPLFVAAIFLGGCHTVAPKPPPPAPLPLAPTANVAGAREPEQVKTYTLGAYVDPDDASLRHSPHAVQRLERAASWNLRPLDLPSPRDQSAATTPTPPAPLPSAPPLATSPVLETPPVEIQTPATVPVVTLPEFKLVPPPTPPPIAMPATDARPIIFPNADGIVDLSVLDRARDDDETNPFAVRAVSARPPREVSLLVSGLIRGAAPCVIVNGRTLSRGDTIESLVVADIESAAAVFGCGDYRVRLPVATTPFRLRLAP